MLFYVLTLLKVRFTLLKCISYGKCEHAHTKQMVTDICVLFVHEAVTGDKLS